VLFEVFLGCRLGDRTLILRIIAILKAKRKRFLLQHFHELFDVVPEFANDPEFQASFSEVISAPLDELIAGTPDTKPFRAHHLSVVRDMFDALASDPFPHANWTIGSRRVGWNEAVARLCASGFPALAVELGSLVVDPDTQSAILRTLVLDGHFDDALRYGFDQGAVFRFIAERGVAQATETMMDDNFVEFVAWLKDHDDNRSIEMVKEALVRQGRTMEVKRMMGRLEAQGRAARGGQ